MTAGCHLEKNLSYRSGFRTAPLTTVNRDTETGKARGPLSKINGTSAGDFRASSRFRGEHLEIAVWPHLGEVDCSYGPFATDLCESLQPSTPPRMG